MPSTQTAKRACEFYHVGFGPTECNGIADWVVEAHGRQKWMCERGARRLRKYMMAGARCIQCHRPRSTHWFIGGPNDLA